MNYLHSYGIEFTIQENHYPQEIQRFISFITETSAGLFSELVNPVKIYIYYFAKQF